MSQWTHINAVLRIDSIAVLGMKLNDMDDIPYGSEGAMHINIWQNPSVNSLASHTITCWGDLRDYDNKGEIMDYFNRITKGQMIRSGLLEIEVEGNAPETYRFDNQRNVFVELCVIPMQPVAINS